MPIFEYHCGKCGHDFEELVFKRDEKVPCPKCKSKKVGKRMSTFARGAGGGNGDDGASHSHSTGGGHSSCGSCSGGSCGTCH